MGLFNIFKKKDKTYQEFEIEKLYNNKKLYSWEDVFKETGIFEIIKSLNKNDSKYHFRNIRANEKTINKLDDMLLKNLIETKNKFSKVYAKEYLKKKHSMDTLCFAPSIDESIKDDIIKLLLPNDKDFTEGVKPNV